MSQEEKHRGKVIIKRAETRESTGGMGHSVPSDCAYTGLQSPRQPDFCILRAVECR